MTLVGDTEAEFSVVVYECGAGDMATHHLSPHGSLEEFPHFLGGFLSRKDVGVLRGVVDCKHVLEGNSIGVVRVQLLVGLPHEPGDAFRHGVLDVLKELLVADGVLV